MSTASRWLRRGPIGRGERQARTVLRSKKQLAFARCRNCVTNVRDTTLRSRAGARRSRELVIDNLAQSQTTEFGRIAPLSVHSPCFAEKFELCRQFHMTDWEL